MPQPSHSASRSPGADLLPRPSASVLARPVAALLLAVLALLAGCGGGSAPPRERKPEVILRTEADDRRVGQEASQQVEAEMGLVRDPDLVAYVNRVGQRLARYAPRGGFDYTFQIVDQEAPNAFALPGGHIYVSRGLLVLSNSEDELAGVLGHEIVHVARRHAAGRQSVMGSVPGLFQMTAMGMVASYSRDQEREADRLGQGLAGLAGYDPQGIADFLTQLEYTERLRIGYSRLPGFLDTHPTTSERVAAAGARARMIAWKRESPFAPDRAAYLARIEGLAVGTRAAEGVFQGDRFLHGDLGFALRVPRGWTPFNTPQAVGAVSPRRDAQVALEFQGRGEDPHAAAVQFIEDGSGRGLSVDPPQPIKIGRLDAVRAEGRAAVRGGSVGAHFTWLSWKGSVYRMSGMALGSTSTLEGVFRSFARSFRPITAQELAAIRERRLHVVVARAGEGLADLSRRANNEWDLQQTAVMNGVFANARLESGQLMKVAISQQVGGRAAD